MKFLLRTLRGLLVWVGPALILLLMVVSGFAWWVLRSEDGTRWALVTVVRQLDGRVSGVQGSIWNNLRIGNLSVSLPGVSVQLDNLHLDARWKSLLQRRLQVHELAVESLSVQWQTTQDDSPSEPFQMPALPLSIQADRIAIGSLHLMQDGVPLPLGVSSFDSALFAGANGGHLLLRSVELQHDTMRVQLQGETTLEALSEPWPFALTLTAQAQGTTDTSPLCARQYLPTLPVQADHSQECTLTVSVDAKGDLNALSIQATGSGQGMQLNADAQILPQAVFPFRQGKAQLTLADGSSLDAALDWQADGEAPAEDKVTGHLKVNKLDIGQLAGAAVPDALLTFALDFHAGVRDQSRVEHAALSMDIAQGSRWNKQPLQGKLDLQVSGLAELIEQFKHDGQAQAERGAPSTLHDESDALLPPAQIAFDPAQVRIGKLNMDIVLGANRLKTEGAWGNPQARLTLDIAAPQLVQFWPGLSGGAGLTGFLTGALPSHTLDIKARYSPPNSQSELGKAPIDLTVQAQGGWGDVSRPGQEVHGQGWRGTIQGLVLSHDEITLRVLEPVAASWVPQPASNQPQWRVGATRLQVQLSKMRTPLLVLDHTVSEGATGRWSTQGRIESLRVSPWRVKRIRQLLGLQPPEEEQNGGVVVLGEEGNDRWAVNLGLNWNLSFAGALQGDVQLRRISGDVMVPAEPDFPLGLETLVLAVQAKPGEGGTSRLTAAFDATTKKMGRLSIRSSSVLRTTAQGGFRIDPSDTTVVDIDAAIDDLAWAGLFTGDAVEFGGKLVADLTLRSRADGQWSGSGTLTGQGLRVVRLDDGIRLLDGTLQARLDGTRVLLEKLYFPARLRVTPKEWRTAEWVSQNPDAKGGGLTISGDWQLLESQGALTIDLYRYPILQRSDRYAMVSGKVRVQADLPRIDVQGQVSADAGWFDLDMLGGIPTVDSDVIVLKPGQKRAEPVVPTEISMSLKLDLGPRFYLTGYGVNSGLVGDLTLTMVDNSLRALGALRTRGGAIEAYGQRLQLRRGTITFQGDITSPVLNIEALRTGLQVEAGVRVAGTARRPRIDLVSYPQVSEIEKLTWLLLGHGPNDSGGDVALLFSVGSSFLSDGEPFYRKFGIDEVSMRSGDLGSVGSILPAESVVSSLDSGTSDIERRFISASKQLASGFTLSVRQALNDTGTIGRISYNLARGLNAELSLGTINGLALIYRWFSRD